jgi:hypothetical protein
MGTHTLKKLLFRLGVLTILLLMLIAESGIIDAKIESQMASRQASVEAQSSNGLAFTAYSATRVATVGQAVWVIAKFVNTGRTTFTNLVIDCPELGRSLINISSTSYPTTVLPGQSGFQEQHWQAVRPGEGPIFCTLTATDTSTGQQVILTAPTVNITVK